MSREVPSHHKPMPELVEPVPGSTPYWIIDTVGKPWLPTNGMTSMRDRKLMVPLVRGARSVSRHELAHVKWSPIELPELDFDRHFLMAVEDARINLGLVRVGLPVLLTASERQRVVELGRNDLAERNALGFVLRSIAATATNVEADLRVEAAGRSDAVRDLCRKHLRRVKGSLQRARARHGGDVAPFEVALRLARELAEDLGKELSRLGYPSELPASHLKMVSCCMGSGRHRELDGHARRVRGLLGLGGDQGGPDGPASGAMRTVTAALVHPCPRPRLSARGRQRPAQEGSVPRALHRWTVDRAVFRRTTRVRGGSVLIDTSGSMSLDAAGVDQLLVASSGAALVAVYSGREDRGELRIVARDGLRADAKDLVPYGRGNIVDEHALTWLARQSGPRLWISDGGVTGVGDVTSRRLQHRCQEIVRRADIRRVKTLEEAVAFLARGARHAGVAGAPS